MVCVFQYYTWYIVFADTSGGQWAVLKATVKKKIFAF